MADHVICTDGACQGNGRPNALAGVGVYFGPDDERNVSKPLRGPDQTNNRAELTAFLHALQCACANAKNNQTTEIITDSVYCKRGYSEWIFNWAARDWTKSDGQPVKNRDLWEQVWTLKELLHTMSQTSSVQITWVRGHTKHKGNEAADRLAVAGITKHRSYVKPKKLVKKRKRRPKKKSVGTQTME